MSLLLFNYPTFNEYKGFGLFTQSSPQNSFASTFSRPNLQLTVNAAMAKVFKAEDIFQLINNPISLQKQSINTKSLCWS